MSSGMLHAERTGPSGCHRAVRHPVWLDGGGRGVRCRSGVDGRTRVRYHVVIGFSDPPTARHEAVAAVEPMLAQAAAAFDAAAVDPAGLSDPAITQGLAEAQRLSSKVRAWQARLVAEANRRELSRRHGCASPASWLVEQLGLSRAEAARRQQEAEAVTAASEVGEALARGEITPEHARIIGAMTAAEPGLPVDGLLDDARRHDAGRFAGHARRRRRVHHADGGLSEFESQRAARSCSMWVRPDDGMIIIRAELDAMAGARPRAVLLAEAERLWRADHPDHHGPVPAEARTNPQRLADALCNIFGRPPTPGLAPETAEVLVSVTLDQLRGDHRQPAEVCGAGPIPAATARRVACEAAIIPVVLGGQGETLDLGRSRRLATRAQRRALRHRYNGCGIHRCDVAWEWCQVHHIQPWNQGGRTDLEAMVPLCSTHHHLVHEGGWTLTRTSDHSFDIFPPETARPAAPPANPAPPAKSTGPPPGHPEHPTPSEPAPDDTNTRRAA